MLESVFLLRKLDGKVIHSQHSDDDEEEEGGDAASAAPSRSERSSVRDSDEEGENMDVDGDIAGGATPMVDSNSGFKPRNAFLTFRQRGGLGRGAELRRGQWEQREHDVLRESRGTGKSSHGSMWIEAPNSVCEEEILL